MIIVFSSTIIVCVLVWSFSLISTIADKIKVIDSHGQYLKTSLESKEKLFKSLVTNHCANTTYYLNSFDRVTIKENQAKALFLVSKSDALRVFSKYKNNNAYAACLDRGLQYRTEFEKLENISEDQEPYLVKFSSILSIHENEKPVIKIRIHSEGELITHSAQYPENINGFYFKTYNQQYEKIEND